MAEHSLIDGEINEKIAKKISVACVARNSSWKKGLDSNDASTKRCVRAARDQPFFAAGSRGALGGSLRSTEITR